MKKNSQATVQSRKPGARRSSPGRATPKSVARHEATPLAIQDARGEPAGAGPTFAFHVNLTRALVCVPANLPILFSLETAAGLTGVHPEMLRYYCRLGLLGPGRAEGMREPVFDEEALHEVRRIEHYRRHLAVSRQALPLVCELRREAERQHIEIHFLRSP